jgi:hypothetical protein
MEIVSSHWARKPVPEQELIGYFRERGVQLAIVDSSSTSNGEPRWFNLMQKELFSAGPLKIVEIPPAPAALGEARGQ